MIKYHVCRDSYLTTELGVGNRGTCINSQCPYNFELYEYRALSKNGLFAYIQDKPYDCVHIALPT